MRARGGGRVGCEYGKGGCRFRKDAGVPSCGVCDIYGVQSLGLVCREVKDAVQT